jgi:hypothetical protein
LEDAKYLSDIYEKNTKEGNREETLTYAKHF